ncbi:MAG: CHASE3 domain-containing protein [Limisphaerales bacterium]
MTRSPVDSQPLPKEADFHQQLNRATLGIITALGLPMLVLLGLVIYLLHSAQWVDHSDRVISEINHEEKLLMTMQSGFRGYRLMGDKDILMTFTKAAMEINPAFTNLENLVADNFQQYEQAVKFHIQTDEWIKMAEGSLHRIANGSQPEEELAYMVASRKTMNDAMQAGEDMLKAEENLRIEREDQLHRVVITLFFGVRHRGHHRNPDSGAEAAPVAGKCQRALQKKPGGDGISRQRTAGHA